MSVPSTPVGPAVPWGLTLVLLVAGCTACPLPSSVFGSYFWERKRGQGSSSTENLCRGLASLLFFLYGWLLCFFFFFPRGFLQAGINWNKSAEPQEARKEAKALKQSSPRTVWEEIGMEGCGDGGAEHCRLLQAVMSSALAPCLALCELSASTVPAGRSGGCVSHWWGAPQRDVISGSCSRSGDALRGRGCADPVLCPLQSGGRR